MQIRRLSWSRSARPGRARGDDRRVAELLAGLRDVDRALLGQQPGSEGRHRRRARQWQDLPGGLRQARERCRGPGGQAAVRRLDALRRQQRGDELAEDDRLAVGDEVGLAGRARSAASSRPSTTLSTWVVSVTLRPPPTQAKRPFSTVATISGSSVVSPLPQTKRGRGTTVSKPARLASRTASSAFAFESFDQPAADEARSACHERCARHRRRC